MITVFVKFPLSPFQSRPAIAQDFAKISELFYNVPELLRKYFIIAEDGSYAGGIYLWETRAAAEAFHADEFKAIIQDRYGAMPEIAFFTCPIVVDNQFSYEFQNTAA
ncbi:MAG TPA: YdhR family protein [Candidatus Obscuribacterales bacterium]